MNAPLRLIAPLLLVVACSKGDPPPSMQEQKPATTTTTTTTTVATPDAATKANEIYSQRCVPCHGAEGRGDGVASASLTPPPRNFHDQAWQQKVTDDQIMLTIKAGGAAVNLSAA